jgi:hypothetical protein
MKIGRRNLLLACFKNSRPIKQDFVEYCYNTHLIQGDTKKRELFKCVVAAMYSWQQCGTETLSYRQPRHLVIMDQWNGQQRAVAIKMFYMFGFLQFLLGFSKVPVFLCHLANYV